MSNTETSFEIAINRIKLIGFKVRETTSPILIEDININMEPKLDVLGEIDAASFQLKITMSSVKTGESLAESIVQNIFMIKNIQQFATGTETLNYRFPEALLTTMVSLSISHARALMANALMGTVYQHIYLPIVNPVEITRHFFKLSELSGIPERK